MGQSTPVSVLFLFFHFLKQTCLIWGGVEMRCDRCDRCAIRAWVCIVCRSKGTRSPKYSQQF